jgi:hypothetical protein
MELCTEREPQQHEVAYVMGGYSFGGTTSSMERFDIASGQWSAVAAMGTKRRDFGACAVAEELYVSGGWGEDVGTITSVSVEK